MSPWNRYKLKRLLKKTRGVRSPKKRVYLAWDADAGRRVIVKRTASRLRSEREREVAEVCADHPHLVRVFDRFVRGRRNYLVVEWAPGQTLKNLILRLPPFKPARVVAIGINLLKGVDVLHRHGFIHADLHAGNVIVSNLRQAKLKIVDYELAVTMGDDGKARARRTLPRPAAHLPPETRRRVIDARYDIYGIGFMCACMLEGRILRRRPRPTRALMEREPIWAVIRKATAFHPANRYASAQEMMEALDALDTSRTRVKHYPIEVLDRVFRAP